MRILYGKKVLYDPVLGVDLLDVELTCSLREASTLVFKMPRTHPAFGDIKLESVEPEIEVREGNVCLMKGRAYSCVDVDDVGTVEYSCEGELAYLNDASVRPYSTVAGAAPLLAPADPYGYFNWLIAAHNARVEPAKRMAVGVNQGNKLDDNDHVLRSDSTYPNIGKVIKEKLLESLGGFIRARYEGGKRYVDYLADTDGEATQRIEFGTNLLSFARTRDGSQIYSAVIPLGKAPEGSDEKLTIKSLGNGDADAYGRYQKRTLDTVVSIDLVAKVGYREISVEFSEITEPKNLLSNAIAWLKSQASEIETIKISAFDLSRIDQDVKPINLGDYVRVTSVPHKYDSYMIVSKIVRRPTGSLGDEYTFGLEGDDIGDVVRKHAQQLNAGINNVYEMAESVDKIAKDAKDKADAAQGSADDANTTAGEAKDKADTAINDATQAGSKAEAAKTKAQDAEAAALAAKAAAAEASAQVVLVETAATEAKTAAENAKNAADAAGSAAASAKDAADAAKDDAADAAAAAVGAGKTATNFLEFVASGLRIGNKISGAWSGFSTRMTSSAFEVLDQAGTVLASYGANLVELGKNSASSVINMVNGLLTISANVVGSVRWANIQANTSMRLRVPKGAALYLTQYDSLGQNHDGLGIGINDSGVHLRGAIDVNDDPLYANHLLYDNTSGNAGLVNMYDYATNYIYIEVLYGQGDRRQSLRIYQPNGREANCQIMGGNASASWWYVGQWAISGKALSCTLNKTYNHMTQAPTASNEVKIYRIIGCR